MRGTIWFAAIALLVVVGALMMPRRKPRSPEIAPDDGDAIDRAALEQAEREIRDMEGDIRGAPTDDVVGDDWGPGSPRPPFA